MKRMLTFAGIAAAVALVWMVPGHQYDFSFDWLLGKAILNGVDPQLSVAEVARQLDMEASLVNSHPRLPGALLIHPLFGLIPFEYMHMAGRLLTVTTALWLGWLVARWRQWPVERVLLVVPILLLVWPFSEVLATSQWAVFVIGGLIGLALAGKDDWRSGLFLAVAVTLKVWPWLIVPVLWQSGRRKTAVSAVGGFAALNLVGLLIPHVSIGGTLAAMSSVLPMEGPLNISPVQWMPIWLVPLVGLAAVALVPRRWRIPLSVPIGLLTSPILWPAYLPALAGLFGYRSRFRSESPSRQYQSAIQG